MEKGNAAMPCKAKGKVKNKDMVKDNAKGMEKYKGTAKDKLKEWKKIKARQG